MYLISTSTCNNISTIVLNKNSSKSKNLIVVCNASSELDVADMAKKWLYISSFKPSVTADVISYVTKHFNIDTKFLFCKALIKKGTSVNDLSSVYYKLGVSSNYYNALLDSNLWPLGKGILPFRFFQK